MSINNRDDFIAALIAELQNQKESQGNKDNFFTGNRLTGSDVFRKLCFDYPMVDDDGLQVFFNELKLLRESFSENEFWQTISFSDKFLENVAYFCTTCAENVGTAQAGSVTTSSQKPANDEYQRKKDVISFIASEIYLLWPNVLLQLNQKQLEHVFRQQLMTFDDQLEEDHEAIQELAAAKKPSAKLSNNTAWSNLLKIYRNYLVKGSANLLGPILTEEVIGTSQSLKAILSMIKAIKPILESNQKAASTLPATAAAATGVRKPTTYKHLLDYVSQILAQNIHNHNTTDKNNNTADEDEEIHEYEQVLAMMKEIYSHLIFLLVDLLSRFPKSLASHITLLCYILLYEAPNTTTASKGPPVTNEITIESLLLSKTTNNAAPEAPPLPSLSHYLCMLALSNIQQHLTKECQVSSSSGSSSKSLLYRPVYEAIRKYFVNNPQSFTLLITVCEQIAKVNNHATANNVSDGSTVQSIDIQSSHFYLDLANFFVMKERNSYYASPTLMSLLPQINSLMLSSQLVHHILTIYVQLLGMYHHQNTNPNALPATSTKGNVAEYWSLLTQCNECVFYMILFHQSYGSFILQYAPLLPAIQRILYDYWRNQYHVTKSNHTTHRVEKYMIWSPFSALSILIALKYVSNSTTSSDNKEQGNTGSLLRSYILTCIDICKQSIQEIDQIVIEEVPFSTEVSNTSTTMATTTTTAATTIEESDSDISIMNTNTTITTTTTTTTTVEASKVTKKAEYQQRLHHQQQLLDSYVTFLQSFASIDVMNHHLYVPIPGTNNAATNQASQNLRKFHEVVTRALQEMYQQITKKRSQLMETLRQQQQQQQQQQRPVVSTTSTTTAAPEQSKDAVDSDEEEGDPTVKKAGSQGQILHQPSNEEDHVLISYYDRIIKLSKMVIPLFQGQQDSNKAD